MNIVYGVELKHDLLSFIPFKDIQKDIPVDDYTDDMLITFHQRNVEVIEEYIKALNAYEQTYALYALKQAKRFNLWNEYGFSSFHHHLYVPVENILTFQLEGLDSTETEMVTLQLKEYVIVKDEDIFFTDAYWQELVQKIATAYGGKITYITSTK